MAPPHLIELDEAISRIKQACEGRSADSPSPFFFMVGAGISCPSVPLAADIVSQCKDVAHSHGRKQEPSGQTAFDLYSHWFQTAYDEPDQRQKYLRGLIDGRPITHANFRLAHLLLNNTISNIVVTVNFDDFLSKALTLFGKPHIVCDHPQTVGRINPAKQILQIVHLHGTYWFYDCCNLRGELEDRALQSKQTTSTMASLLDLILWDRSPLVLGYSGWKGDVFIEALIRRLERPLGTNVYWFCYRRSDLDSIPDELKSKPNIRFVVPSVKSPATATTESLGAGQLKEAGQEPGKETKAPELPKKDDEPTLPADAVLNKLIRAFKLEAPHLTTDPLGFFAARLDDSLPKGEASDSEIDTYAIKGVIERVKNAKKREDEEAATAVTTSSESTLEKVRDAVRRAEFREAVTQGAQIPLDALSTKELDELADAMWSATVGLKDNSKEELLAYDLLIGIRSRLLKDGSGTLAMERQLAEAMYNKGVSLRTIDRKEEAIEVFDELARRYGESTDNSLLEPGGRALFAKAFELGSCGRSEEEMATYAEVVKRYGNSSNTAVREAAAWALFNQAVLFDQRGDGDEALRLYSDVVERFGENTEVAFRECVGKALHNKALKVGLLNRNQESVDLYDEIVQRSGDAKEFVLQEQVAKALINKALKLREMNRFADERAVYLDVIERYEKATEPVLKKIAAGAFNSVGFQALIAAKATLKTDKTAGKNELREAERYIKAARERDPADPIIIGNHAYIAFLLDRKDLARKWLTEAIELGGETLRQGELADADLNRLPEDDEFCELIRSIKPSTSTVSTTPIV